MMKWTAAGKCLKSEWISEKPTYLLWTWRTLGGRWADGVLRERTDEAASEETSSSPVVKLSAPLSILLPSTLLTFCFSKLSSHISPPLLSSPLLSVFFPPVAPSGPLASLFPCPFLYLSFHILLSHLICLSFCPSHISSRYNWAQAEVEVRTAASLLCLCIVVSDVNVDSEQAQTLIRSDSWIRGNIWSCRVSENMQRGVMNAD